MRKSIALSAALALAAGAAFAQQQGVSKNEIVVGTIQDLSGPLAGYGKQARAGMQLRIEELNEQQGSIHGRKVRLIAEDNGYDPKKAALAAQKLVNQDKIFAMLGHIGTAPNMAAMPIQFEKGVVNFMPITAAREMYEPLHRLKYSFAATYYDQIRAATKYMVKTKGYKKVCTMYQDDDFGLEVMRGAEAGLKEAGQQLAEKTTYKRGATDFSSQIARMKDAGCDFVVLGTIIRETLGAIGTARKLGWGVEFLGSSAAYTELIHKLGGPVANGFYATNTFNMPYMDDASKNVRDWANRYKERTKEEPGVFSVYGWQVVDMFIQIANKAGPNLTTDSFIATLDNFSAPRDMFGSDAFSFTKTKHLGSNRSRISQIVNGKWTPVTDYLVE